MDVDEGGWGGQTKCIIGGMEWRPAVRLDKENHGPDTENNKLRHRYRASHGP